MSEEYSNFGLFFGKVRSLDGAPVKNAKVNLYSETELRVEGEGAEYPTGSTDGDGVFVVRFRWPGADIATGGGPSHFNFRLYAYTEENSSNSSNTTASGRLDDLGYMVTYDINLINVFPVPTNVTGILSTMREFVMREEETLKNSILKVEFAENAMSTETTIIVGATEMTLDMVG